MSRPVREASRICPPSMNARARTPSHFISNAQPASSRGSAPGTAIIGDSSAGSGAGRGPPAGPHASGSVIEIAGQPTVPASCMSPALGLMELVPRQPVHSLADHVVQEFGLVRVVVVGSLDEQVVLHGGGGGLEHAGHV